MSEKISYASYLLRLWREAEADETAAWRGEVESIQSGEKWKFSNLAQMCDLLQARVTGENQPFSD